MNRTKAAICFALAGAVVAGFVACVMHDNRRTAKCEFALTKLDFATNSVGEVIQPSATSSKMGLWQDPAMIPADLVKMSLSDRRSGEAARRFVEELIAEGVEAKAASNAVASVRYEIYGTPIPVFVVEVKAEDEEVALKSLSFWMSRIEAEVEIDNAGCLQKSNTGLKGKIERGRKSGENVAKLEAELELATRRFELEWFYHVYLLKSPYIVK